MKTRLIVFLGLVLVGIGMMLNSVHISLFTSALALIMSLLTLLWLYSLYIKDSSIIDWCWGPGFVIVAWFYCYLLGNTNNTRAIVLCTLVSIWGLRLGWYIYSRNNEKGEEDYRYQNWRKQHGKHYWWVSYLRVFVLQGIIMWVVAATLFAAQFNSPQTLQWLDYFGIVLWAIGFYFEAVGDWQLAQFKKDIRNKGKVMQTGLWRYTRHPNYFGDALLWWGFYTFALSNLAYDALCYLYAPALMTFLLLKISGAALLEKDLRKTKPKYAEYERKTSVFIPWWPKK